MRFATSPRTLTRTSSFSFCPLSSLLHAEKVICRKYKTVRWNTKEGFEGWGRCRPTLHAFIPSLCIHRCHAHSSPPLGFEPPPPAAGGAAAASTYPTAVAARTTVEQDPWECFLQALQSTEKSVPPLSPVSPASSESARQEMEDVHHILPPPLQRSPRMPRADPSTAGSFSTSTSPPISLDPINTSLLQRWAETSGPLFCTRLSECHVIASALWYYHIRNPASGLKKKAGRTTGSAERASHHLQAILAWWEEVSRRILLPRDVESIEDVPLFLSTVLHWPPLPTPTIGSSSASYAHLPNVGSMLEEQKRLYGEDGGLGKLQEWILMHTPPPPPPCALPPPLPSPFSIPGRVLLSSSSFSSPLLLSASKDIHGNIWRTEGRGAKGEITTTENKRDKIPTPVQVQDVATTTSSTSPMIEPWETISYTRLLGLLQSYMRYHRGVVWGVEQQEEKMKKGDPYSRGFGNDKESRKRAQTAFYKRRYHLHPWDNIYCPEGSAAQRPYVDILQWMLRSSSSASSTSSTKNSNSMASPNHSWGATLPKSLRAFHAPFSFSSSTRDERCGKKFSAVDVCSQSGFAVDLLLKAGASHVLAVDTSVLATANTEANYHEHQREKRSSGSERGGSRRPRVQIVQAGVLPKLYHLKEVTTLRPRRHVSGGGSNENTQPLLQQSLPPSQSPSSTLPHEFRGGLLLTTIPKQGAHCSSSRRSSLPFNASPQWSYEAAAKQRRVAAWQMGQKIAAHQERERKQREAQWEVIEGGVGEAETAAGEVWEGDHYYKAEMEREEHSIFRSPSSFSLQEAVDVLWYHPPAPSALLPFTPHCLTTPSSSVSVWQSHIEKEILELYRQSSTAMNGSGYSGDAGGMVSAPQKRMLEYPRGEAHQVGSSCPSSSLTPSSLPWSPVSHADANPNVRDAYPSHRWKWDPLPWIPFPALTNSHPHHSHRVLQQLLDSIMVEPSSSSVYRASTATIPFPTSGSTQRTRSGAAVTIKPGGFMIFLLPRSYQPLEDMLTALEKDAVEEEEEGRRRGESFTPPPSASHRNAFSIHSQNQMNEMKKASFWSNMGSVSDTVCQAFTVPSSTSSCPSSSFSTPMVMPPGAPHLGMRFYTVKEEYELVAFKRYATPLEGEEWQQQQQEKNLSGTSRSEIRRKGEGKDQRSSSTSPWTWRCLCDGLDDGDSILQQWKSNTPPQWMDLLIFRRKPRSAVSSSSATAAASIMNRASKPNGGFFSTSPTQGGGGRLPPMQWEDTMEYDEYLPETLPTSYHWTDQLPTFSYLEDDFVDGNTMGSVRKGEERCSAVGYPLSSTPPANVLAHGPLTVEKVVREQVRSTALGSPTSADHSHDADGDENRSVPVSAWKPDADAAAAMFKTVFREELKRRRRTSKKFQRIAMSSSRDQQEWYIDEKLVKSEAAKIDLMNEISRFNFQENRDH